MPSQPPVFRQEPPGSASLCGLSFVPWATPSDKRTNSVSVSSGGWLAALGRSACWVYIEMELVTLNVNFPVEGPPRASWFWVTVATSPTPL